MTSHFRSATRSRLQAAFTAKHTTMYMPPSNGAKVMLGFQYLIYICIDPFMVQFKYCLCFANQETASVAAPIVLIDQKAASEHHSVGACSVSQVGEPSWMFVRWASHPQWQSIDVSVMFQHMMHYIRLAEVMLHYGSPSALDVFWGGRAILNDKVHWCFDNVSTHGVRTLGFWITFLLHFWDLLGPF